MKKSDSRDRSCQPAPSPSLCYSLTHAHRSIGYRNRIPVPMIQTHKFTQVHGYHNPQPLSESSSRLMYLRVYDNRDRSCHPSTSPSLSYSLTHKHRSIGYHNHNPKPLTDSSTRLMYLRVYDNRDRSFQPAPSPSLRYKFTHSHRSIGYHNPRSLSESVTRLMYRRVYDNRDRSCQRSPSPSLSYSLTHTHRSTGYRIRNPQSLSESTVRLIYRRVYNNRDRPHQCAPSPSLCYSLTHEHSTLPTPTLLTITFTQVLWFLERLSRTTVSCCVTTRTRFTVCLPS